MAKNKKLTEAQLKARKEAIYQPTSYLLDFKAVPVSEYAKALDIIIHDPSFCEDVEKRNNLAKSAQRLPSNSSQFASALKAIQQRDQHLADVIFGALVHISVYSDNQREFLSFNNILKYYVDYSREGVHKKVDNLASNLDKIVFLSDMLESILMEIKQGMNDLFSGSIEFAQFDAVQIAMQQLNGFFKSSPQRSDVGTRDNELYIEYSDSINNYLDKRLKTYSEKYNKLHPASPRYYTADDMVKAINQYFDSGNHFGMNFIKRTENGGAYIDAFTLSFNLTPSQTEKIDKAMGHVETTDQQNWSFAMTDVIMAAYKPE